MDEIHNMRGLRLMYNVMEAATREDAPRHLSGLALCVFLIQEYKIATKYDESTEQWIAEIPVKFGNITRAGPDPITAAMRIYLVYKAGDATG